METIYNLINPAKPIENGVVEIFQTYDGSYYSIALDGKILEECYKSDYQPTLLSRKFIRQCCKISGISEEELHFVYYDFYYFGDDHEQDYDANDYMGYKDMRKLVKKHVKSPEDMKKFKDKYMKYEYHGIDDLEDNIV